VPGGWGHAQDQFTPSEASKGCALLGRNHHSRLLQRIYIHAAFLPRHGRVLNCEIYLVRRKLLDAPHNVRLGGQAPIVAIAMYAAVRNITK
jgi:hypothetical protein